MGDTLEIFGKEYTNVAGFKAKDSSGNTLTYTRGGGGGVSEFVITLTKNSNNLWETNKTFAEITTAYNAGNILRVAAQNPGSGADFPCETYCEYNNTGSTPNFNYQITWFDYNDDINNGDFFEDLYTLNSNGLTLNDRQIYGTPKTLVSKTITANGTYDPILTDYADGYSNITVNVSPTLQSKTATPSETAQTITADSGYDGLSSVAVGSISNTYIGSGVTRQAAKTVTPTESSQTAVAAGVYTTGAVTVGAISSTYVGSGITQRDGDDLTASGATVTAPAGYYASQATKSVASGSAGTPTATKGTVSNHSITVTPSVTNTTGYITGGTKSGTGVTVSASELVSGSQTITANGTVNVTNLASVNVALTFSTIYTGTSTPSSSTGSNGDIYVKTS